MNKYWLGKKLSEEHKRKMVETRMKNRSYGHTEATKLKMSETQKRIGNKPPSPKGRKWTEEMKIKFSIARKGKPSLFKGKKRPPFSEEWKKISVKGIKEKNFPK